MENHHFYGKTQYKWPFSIAMLVYQRVNLHFPMVFLWFSYGFPVVHPHISHITRAAESVATSRGASGAASADRVTYNAALAACRNASRWIEVANGAMNVRKKTDKPLLSG